MHVLEVLVGGEWAPPLCVSKEVSVPIPVFFYSTIVFLHGKERLIREYRELNGASDDIEFRIRPVTIN